MRRLRKSLRRRMNCRNVRNRLDIWLHLSVLYKHVSLCLVEQDRPLVKPYAFFENYWFLNPEWDW